MLAKIALFSFRKRWLVLLVWVALLAGITIWSQTAGSAFSTDFKLPESDSQAALDLLQSRFPTRSGATGDLVFKSASDIHDPAVQAAVGDAIKQIMQVPHVSAVVSPYSQEGATQVSPDGHIARAVIMFDRPNQEIERDTATTGAIKDIVAGVPTDGIQFELGGQLFVSQPNIGTTEIIGITAAIIILLIAFGSVLAMGLPIITALFGIGIGVSAVALFSHVISLPDFTTELSSMIGIGVGIDYALFIVTRYRQGLDEKLSPEQATITAINTAGRSVIFAGLTVVISLLGMVLINISFIQGLGIGAASVVAVTMLASITLLPAVLGFVRERVDKLRIPGIGKRKQAPEQGIWYRWGRLLERYSWPAFLIGLVVVVILAIPVLSIRLGSSDASARPTSDTTRRAYDLEAEGFGPGSNGPLLLASQIGGQGDLAILGQVQQAAQADEGVAFVTPPVPNQDFSAAIMQVIPKTSPQDEGTVELTHRLREQILPAVTNGSDVQVHVGGLTAAFEDVSQILTDRLPVFIGTVLALSFILIMVVFRSVVIPIKAVVLNMLSIGAAYGVVVAVFQWGWGESLLGLGSTGPIESFVPMMLFAILFGLSMDYEVFLLSRIKEEYDRSGNNNLAIVRGLSLTAHVITAAAAIMITVFGSFVLGDQRIIKEFGFGLAVAVLIDASIVRLILVPATMEILGKANWWFPKWLKWLPEVHVDAVEVAAPTPGDEQQ